MSKDTVLIQDYLNTQQGVEEAKRALSHWEEAALNAYNNLARHLVPKDAELGDRYSVWVDDLGLILTAAVKERPVTTRYSGSELDHSETVQERYVEITTRKGERQ